MIPVSIHLPQLIDLWQSLLNENAAALCDAMVTVLRTIANFGRTKAISERESLIVALRQPEDLKRGDYWRKSAWQDSVRPRLCPRPQICAPARPSVCRQIIPIAACMASQYAGWQISVGEVLCDGFGTDAGNGFKRATVRQDWPSRDGQGRGGRVRNQKASTRRCLSANCRSVRSRPLSQHFTGRAHGQHRRNGPGGGPKRRNDFAQVARIGF